MNRLPKPVLWLAVLAFLGLADTVFALPAWADHAQKDTEKLVRWAGCQAPVVTSDAHSVLESFFDGERLYIGTAKDTLFDVWLMVMLHETAHCLQYQQYGEQMEWSYGLDPKAWELDADRRSATLACGLGLDGPQMLHDLFVWAYQEYGYEGDESHGTIMERIHMGDGACTPTRIQAPEAFLKVRASAA